MHGRLKVRTSEEQAAEKRKEKERKVKWYRQTTERIFEKRAAEEKDDEQLKLTIDILQENSDISTLWIIRREVLESKLKSMSDEEAVAQCQKELLLLERCLRGNPKAYCVWLHRQWVMDHTPSPDWRNEKKLCDLFLSHDERNFHCWDYRRFVIKKANIEREEEFQFTTDKIATNFSNYSAWHYRSKLLPSILASTSAKQHTLENEYEMTHNAIYTDPSDQSPWFYHKWLLGKGDIPLIIGCGLLQRNPSPLITVSFNQPIKPTEDVPLIFSVNGMVVTKVIETDWPKRTWTCNLSISDEESVIVTVQYKEHKMELKLESNNMEEICHIGDLTQMFKDTVTRASVDVLSSELAICKELLTLEPDNKWCILTTLKLMQAIDPFGDHQEILNLFDKLVIIDPSRKGYYNDLRSRQVISYELRSYFTRFDPTKSLDLSNKGLTRLYYTEYMIVCRHVNLSGNNLPNFSHEHSLRNVRTLDLSCNLLQGDVPFNDNMPLLESLCLDKNGISSIVTIEKLVNLKNLQHLSLKGNSLSSDTIGTAKNLLKYVERIEF